MSDYLYHPNSKELYHQSLKALTCVHTRLVRGLIEKRSLETEAWLGKHIEKCEQCRTELQAAIDEEKFIASHIPNPPLAAEFEAELELMVQKNMRELSAKQNKALMFAKVFGHSLKELASQRIFWLGLIFGALLVVKLMSVDL